MVAEVSKECIASILKVKLNVAGIMFSYSYFENVEGKKQEKERKSN
jgi:hypothetical protein